MAEPTNQNTNQAANQAPDQANDNAPMLSILAQYIKDMSFENPQAPNAAPQSEDGPSVDINVNVGAQKLFGDDYEVTLNFKVETKTGDVVSFILELVYAGVFRVKNIPENEISPVLLIEAPRQIFPFARRILADITRDGGFPPILLDPINFAAIYQRNKEQQEAAQKNLPPELQAEVTLSEKQPPPQKAKAEEKEKPKAKKKK